MIYDRRRLEKVGKVPPRGKLREGGKVHYMKECSKISLVYLPNESLRKRLKRAPWRFQLPYGGYIKKEDYIKEWSKCCPIIYHTRESKSASGAKLGGEGQSAHTTKE